MGVLVKAQGRITDLPVMAKSSLRRLTSSRCICQTLTMSEIRDPRGSTMSVSTGKTSIASLPLNHREDRAYTLAPSDCTGSVGGPRLR